MIDQVYYDKVLAYFKGNKQKTWLWFQTVNPALGGVTPMWMIKHGREAKLKQFIDTRLKGYL